MTKKSVLVIGLDGATWKVLRPLLKKKKLPFLAEFLQVSSYGISQSTLPPLTPSVWTSFLTGVGPGKHRIFGFLNYRKTKNDFFSNKDINFISLPQLLKQQNKKAYISFGDLNGLIKEAGVETDKVSVNDLLVSIAQKSADFKASFKKIHYDFSFLLFKEVDKAQHLFWQKAQLEKFFCGLDDLLADLIGFYRSTPGDKSIIILSDHGFHKSATHQFSVYPWLVSQNYIPKHEDIKWNIIHGANNFLKTIGINITNFPFVANLRRKIVNQTEKLVGQKTSDLIVSFEGIYLKQKSNGQEIVNKLKKLKLGGKKVFQKVALAKAIYKGPYFDYGPDIVWLPSVDFTINISPLEKKIFSPRPTQVYGDHIADIDGISIFNGKQSVKLNRRQMIYDWTSIIYDLLKVKKPLGLDGVSVLADYTSLDKKVSQAKKVIFQVLKKYPTACGIAFTGRKDSSVMIHLVKQVVKEKGLPMPFTFFIDHGQHFTESIKFLKFISKKWKIDLRIIKPLYPANTPLGQVKIQALNQLIAKHKLQVVMSAIRKDESPARKKERPFSMRQNHLRVHPVLNFSEQDIWDYIKRFNLPYNPLYDQGYRSLEEKRTTQKVYSYTKPERSGRDKQKEKIMTSLRKLGYF